jgi:hypothetical protein
VRKNFHLLLILLIGLAACAEKIQTPVEPDATEPAISTMTPSFTPTFTMPVASVTFTSTETPSETPTTPSEPTISFTPRPTKEETPLPTSDQPGIYIYGSVSLPVGTGLAGVPIYYAFASYYPGNFLATTDQNGNYSSFVALAGDETVRVWAELSGYEFKPGKSPTLWFEGEYAWRHYGGYERVKLEFVATGK